MNTNTAIKAYSIILTLVIILVMVWRAGYQAGRQDTTDRISDVLNVEIKKDHLGGTFDAICNEFSNELK